MDVCPIALLNHLRSDIRRGLVDPEDPLLTADCNAVRAKDARINAARMLESVFLKKFSEGADRKLADKRAIELFLKYNEKCANWRPPVSDDAVVREVLGEFQSKFLSCFETFDGQLVDFSNLVPCHFRHGPGASIGVKVRDFYTKHCASSLASDSESLYWHYYNSTLPFQLQHEAELTRSACFPLAVVRGSSLSCVTKNREISRTTCTEPPLNMLYQLGTGSVLEGILDAEFGIRLDVQPDLNRELARRGSITSYFGTVDLRSASDCTANGLFAWLSAAYPEIHGWFNWIRSKRTQIGKKEVQLHMLSSMGNGFTFPLMTLIFACLVWAVYKVMRIPFVRPKHTKTRSEPGNWAVFGDDIIVRSDAFAMICQCLELIGYEVNAEKSFGAGPFRESCGTDWFLGRNIRGVYCRKLSKPQYRYALINRLNAWSSEWDFQLPDTIRYLRKSVWFIPIPPWESASSGIMVPLSYYKPPRKHDMFVYSAMRPRTLQWEPERGLTERHDRTLGSFDSPSKKNPGFVNDPGILLAAVMGYLRDHKASIPARRDDDGNENVLYKKTRLNTPGWAYTGESSAGFSRAGWARFESYLAQSNLGRVA